MRKTAFLILKLGLGAAIFAFIFSKIPLLDSVKLLRGVSGRFLAAAFLCLFMANALQVLRWQVVLKASGSSFSFLRLTAVNLVGIFFSNFLPGSVGGDVFKVFYIVDPRQSGQIMSATILSRIVGMIAVLMLGLAVMPFASEAFTGQPWWTSCGIALSAAAVVSGAILLPAVQRLLTIALAALRVPDKHVAQLTSLLDPVRLWLRSARTVAATFVLALLYQIVGPVSVLYLCARSLGLALPIPSVAMIAVLANVAFALPISLNGLGVAEGVYVYLFMLLGAPGEQALLLALLFRVVCVTQALAGGVVYFFLRSRPHAPLPDVPV